MNTTLAYLNGNGSKNLLGLGETARLIYKNSDDFSSIQAFIDAHAGSYIFAGLSYDLKEKTLNMSSVKPNNIGIPDAFFWVPEVVVSIENNQISAVCAGTLTSEHEAAVAAFFAAENRAMHWDLQLQPRTQKQDYLKTVEKLLHEIQMGTIYEVNYCQEFFNESFRMTDSEAAYFKLNRITEAPFSAYISFDEHRILCGSPERFLQRDGTKILSQPIKGTSKRGKTPEEDAQLKQSLAKNPKERSENVMIVDLVRNDLSKIAQKNSVQVDELFGVYSFNTVHQLISTISCEVRHECSFTDILNATFPMGSMTGAPKRSAIDLIEQHENFRRGWYSGSIGYIAPNGDFDFNVVIRSILYNSKSHYLSCAVGGAITIQSTAEAEYEECKVKVKTILDRMHE